MRVFLAGPYSSDNVMGVLSNIREGQNRAAYLLHLGFDVYCPWLDHELCLSGPGCDLTEQMLKKNSMSWLEVSDAVFCVEGWEKSKGTLAEIARAEELGIPVIYNNMSELMKLRGE